jgi:hypothetical protein
MRSVLAICCCASVMLATAAADAQQRRTTRRATPAPAAVKSEAAEVTCREQLGTGLRTKANYCFVLAGRDPAEGVLVKIPAHSGTATLTFHLHNRHTYSEEQMKAGDGYARYTAVVGVLTMDGGLLGRGAVQSEFRTQKDLFERIGGGAGPGGAKAVAPIGDEAIHVEIPADVTEVSLLGELLDATTAAGRESAAPGRPVAIVSNIRVDYRPAPAPTRRR